MALPLIGAALAGLGRLGVVAGRAVTGTTARRVGYGAALGDLATDAVIGAGKGLVGGLKGAMMSEAPGLTGAYAFGKELRKRAGASRGNASSPPSPSANKSSSSTPVIGGLGSLNTASLLVSQKQSNIINLEQVRQLKRLNDSVINQSRLLKFTIDDTKRKDQFAEEVANEQAIRDDELLEAIRNIGPGGAGGSKQAANDPSSGGFLSSLLGGAAGGAAGGAISKLIPVLTAFAAAMPWARILGIVGRLSGPALAAAAAQDASTTPSSSSNTPSKPGFIGNLVKDARYEKAIKEAQKRAAEDATDKPRPLDYVSVSNNPASVIDQREKHNTKIRQDIWDKTEKGKRNPLTGKRFDTLSNMPASGTVTSVFTNSPETERESTIPNMSKTHKGVDIGMPGGSPVFSTLKGKVSQVDVSGGVPDAKGYKSGLGRFVVVEHIGGLVTKYAHLRSVNVTVGQEVGPGIALGTSGGDTDDPGSGASTAPHLHFETISGGKHVNPAVIPGLEALGVKGSDVSLAGAAVGAPSNSFINQEAPNSSIQRGADGILPAGTLGNQDARMARLRNPAQRGGSQLPQNPPIGSIGDKQGNAEKELDIIIDPSKQVAGPTDRQFSPLKSKSLPELLKLRERIVKYPLSEKTTKALKVIDDEIKNRKASSPAVVVSKAVVSNSDALGGQLNANELANVLYSPLSANANMLTNPNALTVASADGKFLPDGGIPGSGTMYDDGPISVIDAALLKETIKNNKAVVKGTGGPAVAKPASGEQKGNQLPTKVIPPFKPDYKSNTEILAEANKQFLKELRSTFTGLTRKGLQDALLPNGVGVSFKQATQDNLFRGQQLKIINDTTKKINVAAVDLLGKKYGPMFAPMLDKLSTSYFEVGSRLVGRQLFNRFGELDAKETMGITGQVLGNIAAGKKQLAAEQLLFGMSGGRERGIALNAESLFAKYGFEDSQQGISYFADVLGEKATQPFSKVFGADDRSKSIIRDPRTNKLVYADSGREASKDDIKAGYGGRISQSSMLGETNEYMEVPGYPGSVAGTGGPRDDYTIYDKNDKDKIIGRMAGGLSQSSVTGGSIGGAVSRGTGIPMQQYAQVRGANPTQADVLGITPKQFNSDLEKNTLLAEAQTAVLRQNARADGIRAAEAIKAEAKIAADAATNSGDQALAAKITAEAAAKANEIITIKGAEVVVDGVSQAVGGGKEGAGSTPAGLKASGRRSGQLFDANVYDKAGKIEGKDPMKEIGNFGFDMFKLAAGSELTKDISNPYMQTITNFAIQKGMNYAVDSIMKSDIFSTMGSAAASSSSYGGVGDAFSSILGWIGFKTGGLVRGPGTGKSDSIPAMLSAGEFVINAEATKRNLAVLNAINASTLKKADTKKTIKSDGADYTDSGGHGGGDGHTGGGSAIGGLGVGPGQGVSTSTQSLALGVMAFASKYPSWAPLGIVAKAAGWLAGKAADSQMEKMADAQKAIEAIDKQNAAALESGSSRTFDPYNGQKGVLSVSDANGNVRSFDPYAGDSEKDAGRAAALSASIADAREARDIENAAADKAKTDDAAFAAAQAAYSGPSTSSVGGGGTSANSGADGEGCVDPATLILLANGTKIPAGKLKVGDFLHTLHEDTFVYDDFEVVYVKTVQQPKNIVTFTDGHNLTASDSHKFLMSNRTWKRVDALEAGDTIETAKGVNSDGFKTVAKIEAIGLGDVVKLTIDNAHTYVSEGLVSHNKDLAKGGLIRGPGTGISDSIPAMLSDGEYVINAKATKANLALLKSINSRSSSGSTEELAYNKTLYMKPFESIVAVKKYATGGLVARNNNMNAVAVPTNRSQYILSPPTNNSSSENQNNSSNMIIGPKTSTSIDNSSVTNFYNQASGMIDSIRSVTPQMA